MFYKIELFRQQCVVSNIKNPNPISVKIVESTRYRSGVVSIPSEIVNFPVKVHLVLLLTSVRFERVCAWNIESEMSKVVAISLHASLVGYRGVLSKHSIAVNSTCVEITEQLW